MQATPQGVSHAAALVMQQRAQAAQMVRAGYSVAVICVCQALQAQQAQEAAARAAVVVDQYVLEFRDQETERHRTVPD